MRIKEGSELLSWKKERREFLEESGVERDREGMWRHFVI